MRIPLNDPIEVRLLREVASNSSKNEILLGTSYHIATRRLSDIVSELVRDGLDDADRIILVKNYREGSVYLGDVCRVSWDNYRSIWYLKHSTMRKKEI